MKIKARLEECKMTGSDQNRNMLKPNIRREKNTPLLYFMFKTKPPGTCVRVNTQPLQFIYDAMAVNRMLTFFKHSQDITLNQLSQATRVKYKELKEQSASALHYTLSQKKSIDIEVNLQSPSVIIPHGGDIRSSKNTHGLFIQLGNLSVSTDTKKDSKLGQSLDDVKSKAYDTYNIQLHQMHVRMINRCEDEVLRATSRSSPTSPCHILYPVSIHMILDKCMLDEDPMMPKIKIRGDLPLLSFNVSDLRLQNIISLVQSIPLPETDPQNEVSTEISDTQTMYATDSQLSEELASVLSQRGSSESTSSIHDFTVIQVEFVFEKISLSICQRINNIDVPLLKGEIDNTGLKFQQRLNDMIADFHLGGIYLQYIKDEVCGAVPEKLDTKFYQKTEQGYLLNLINTSASDKDSKLLEISYTKANQDYVTNCNKKKHSVKVAFAGIEMLLHIESIIDLKSFAQSILPTPKQAFEERNEADKKQDERKGTFDKAKIIMQKKIIKDSEEIDLEFNASFQVFQLFLCTNYSLLTDINIKGLETKIIVQEKQTLIKTKLKELYVRNPEIQPLYPRVIETQASELFDFSITLFNDTTHGENYADMERVDVKVDLVLGRINVNILENYNVALCNFVIHLQAALNKLKKASDAIVVHTHDAVQHIQKYATRVSSNIDMSAPVIFVSKHSKTLEGLMVNFGRLTVTNLYRFKTGINEGSTEDTHRDHEEINIELTKLEISRVTLRANQQSIDEKKMIKPITVTLVVKRYIETNWTYFQDIHIGATLKAMTAKMSLGDFAFCMQLVNNHLTTGLLPAMNQTDIHTQYKDKTSKGMKTDMSPSNTETKDKCGKAAVPHRNLTVEINVERVQIIVINDQSNYKIDTLSLDTCFSIGVKHRPDRLAIAVQIVNFGVVPCNFNDILSCSKILPCNILIEGALSQTNGVHIRLSGSDLDINISPATIRLIISIHKQMLNLGNASGGEVTMLKNSFHTKMLSKCDSLFTQNESEKHHTNQLIDVDLHNLVVRMDGDIPDRTVPLLAAFFSFKGRVRDWSNKLNVTSSIKMKVRYYNATMSAWEPLLETVFNQNNCRPCDLQLEIKDTGLQKMAINISSMDDLQLTITKAGLGCLTYLGEAFGKAYMLVEPKQIQGTLNAPYVLKNMTGLDLTLILDEPFEMPSSARNGRVVLQSGHTLGLRDTERPPSRYQLDISGQHDTDKFIHFQAANCDEKIMTIKLSDKELVDVRSKGGQHYAIVCETKSDIGQKIMTFRSSIKVTNHLSVPVTVFYCVNSTDRKSSTTVKEDEIFYLPLQALYKEWNDLVFQPDGCQFEGKETNWKGEEKLGIHQLSCNLTHSTDKFYFNVCKEIEDVFPMAKSQNIHIHPTVIVTNRLPYKITVVSQCTTIEPGHCLPLNHANVEMSTIDIRIPDYQGKEWSGSLQINADIPVMSVLSFQIDGRSINLGLHFKQGTGTYEATIFSPYWLVNKTKKDLMYKERNDEEVQHPASANVVMFSFKTDISKERISLKIEGGDWSESFALETVGISGTVNSKSGEPSYTEVGYSINSTTFGLTKIVIFTPYFMLANTSKYVIMVNEINTSNWIEVPKKQCIPLWPVQTGNKMEMVAKIKDTDMISEPFAFYKSHITLIQIESTVINVECTVTETESITTFSKSMEVTKSAEAKPTSVLIVTKTNTFDVKFRQCDSTINQILQQGTSGPFTWDNQHGTLKLGDEVNDTRTFDITLDIRGIRLSLVNDETKKTVADLAITSPDITWERMGWESYESFNGRDFNELEAAYRTFKQDRAAGQIPQKVIPVNNRMEVDFENMLLRKQPDMEIKTEIRRIYQEGIWLQLKKSQFNVELQAKIYSLQIDNKIPECLYPTVLSPAPPLTLMSGERGNTKTPFLEIRLVQNTHERSREIEVLIQGMHVTTELSFIENILEVFFAAEMGESRIQQKLLFGTDMESTQTDLITAMGISFQKNMLYEKLKISEIKVHVSLTDKSGNTVKDGPTQFKSDAINQLLAYIGAVCNVDDDFKLESFESNCTGNTNNQLVWEMADHYKRQLTGHCPTFWERPLAYCRLFKVYLFKDK